MRNAPRSPQIRIPLLLLLVFGSLSLPLRSSAAALTAASCALADVQAAVNSAAAGDTVNVPAGNCSWTDRLTITKGVILHGAGIGQTVIKAETDPLLDYALINYNPASPAANEPFRLTGFTLDCNFKANGVKLQNYSTTKVDRVRIDHNRILNAKTKYTGRLMFVHGAVYGVVDNNIFENAQISSLGASETSWNYFPRDFGARDTMYYEDNQYINRDTYHDAGHGGRYALRYNDFTSSANLFPIFDMHGNQLGNLHATMVGEFYGNRLEFGNYGGDFLDQRGGQALVYNNKLTGAQGAWTRIREEYDDAISGGYPMHVMNSYYWNNRSNDELFSPYHDVYTGTATGGTANSLEDTSKNFSFCTAGSTCRQYGVKITSGAGAGQFRQVVSNTATSITVAADWQVVPDTTSHYQVLYDCCDAVQENRDYFAYTPSFDGTQGVGCGTLARRPATCTAGVGYWATEQRCDLVDTETIGRSPPKPIAGTLYKCIAPNSWTAYYTPYTYPHPLRAELADPVPAAPDNLRAR